MMSDRLRRTLLAVLLAGIAFSTTAAAGGDLLANPAALLRSIALKSATLTTLLGESNSTLERIHGSLAPLEELNTRMATLVDETGESQRRTRRIAAGLDRLDRRVGGQQRQLRGIVVELRGLDGSLSLSASETGRSLSLTTGMGSDFDAIEHSLGGIAVSLDRLLRSMSLSVPKVTYFARNRLLKSSPGGLAARYRVPNTAAGTRVMSVMLPMIGALQFGGTLIARKDSATASSQFILDLLNQQVPDGTNVSSTIHRFDGRYGLPSPGYFVGRPVGGF